MGAAAGAAVLGAGSVAVGALVDAQLGRGASVGPVGATVGGAIGALVSLVAGALVPRCLVGASVSV